MEQVKFCKLVEIKTLDLSEFISNLPGRPMTRSLLDAISHQIMCIEREREIRDDKNYLSNEFDLLRAYADQFQHIVR